MLAAIFQTALSSDASPAQPHDVYVALGIGLVLAAIFIRVTVDFLVEERGPERGKSAVERLRPWLARARSAGKGAIALVGATAFLIVAYALVLNSEPELFAALLVLGLGSGMVAVAVYRERRAERANAWQLPMLGDILAMDESHPTTTAEEAYADLRARCAEQGVTPPA
jgi:hypothetical protein